MRQGVVFSPGAAAKIRQAVTSANLTGRGRAIVGGGGGAPAKAVPMPLDLGVSPVTVSQVVEQHAMVRIAGLYVGNGDDSLPLFLTGGANSGLSTAISDGYDYWDAGALTENAPTMGFCLYILKVVGANVFGTGNEVELKWGIATGTTVAAAIAAIPAASGTGETRGDILGTLACVPFGYASVSLTPAVAQLWRGVVVTPKMDEVTVMTDFQYDLATHKLQKKTRTVLLPTGLPETEFTTVTGGTAEAHS